MSTLTLWAPFTVLQSVRLLPMLVKDGKLSFDFAEYVASPAYVSRSPSWFAARAAAARALADACVPTLEGVAEHWGWGPGTTSLHRESRGNSGAARVLRDARGFIAHLVLNGVLPPTGPGLVALKSCASYRPRRAGGQGAGGLLAHIVPGSGPVTAETGLLSGLTVL